VELGLKLTFLLKEKVLPDPKLSTPERKRRKLSRKPGFRAPSTKRWTQAWASPDHFVQHDFNRG